MMERLGPRVVLVAALIPVILGSPVSSIAQVAGIDLGDIAAGGDGTGTAAPGVIGIHPDLGILEGTHINGPIGIVDGMSLQPVGDLVSVFIDSVFIIDVGMMPINSAGVTFDFPPEDVLGQTWDHILKDRIGGENTLVSIGGTRFERGVGIHAAAGITYDLDEIRNAHGNEAVGVVTAFAGMGDSPDCVAAPGWVTAYMILSDDGGIIDSVSHRASVGGELLSLPIPLEARYLTLASGAGDGQFYCNAGTFAEAFIISSDCPAQGDTHCTGLSVDPPGGGPGTYTVTATAADDSGDPILYTFSATSGANTLRVGPQASNSATFELTGGTWMVSAAVDDDPGCPDQAPDASCAPVQVVACPAAGDTHCTGLAVVPGGGPPGEYTATAAALDDSGDPVLYTFTADNGVDPPIEVGPQPGGSAAIFLTTGTWMVSASVDDDPGCADRAADAACAAVQVVVGEGVMGLDLGDIAAGGDGTGSAFPGTVGIHPDTGLLDTAFVDGPIGVADGMALQPVEDAVSIFIDSVFIIAEEEMPINSAGVTFPFPPEDLLDPPQTWGQILDGQIGGELTPISIGGRKFEKGVGIHAAAGITYDLEELRAEFGPEAVAEVEAFAGMGDSASDPSPGTGFVTTYLILSDDVEIIRSVSHRASTDDGASRGKLLRLCIPPEARFLTLAAGAGNGMFFFNSGTFGGALVTPVRLGDTRCTGLNITGPPGNAPGTYTLMASASDASGDPIRYTFTADNGVDPPLQAGPQDSDTARFELGAGKWKLTVVVDDAVPECPRPPGAEICSAEIEVAGAAGGGQLPNDCNQDGFHDISDPVCLLGHLFLGELLAVPCGSRTIDDPAVKAVLDTNGDGLVDISDPVTDLAFQFLGQEPPANGVACKSVPGCAESCAPGP